MSDIVENDINVQELLAQEFTKLKQDIDVAVANAPNPKAFDRKVDLLQKRQWKQELSPENGDVVIRNPMLFQLFADHYMPQRPGEKESSEAHELRHFNGAVDYDANPYFVLSFGEERFNKSEILNPEVFAFVGYSFPESMTEEEKNLAQRDIDTRPEVMHLTDIDSLIRSLEDDGYIK